MKVRSTGAKRVGYDDSALVDMKDGDRFRPLGEGDGDRFRPLGEGDGGRFRPLGEGVATFDGAMLGDAEGENEGGDWVATLAMMESLTYLTVIGFAPPLAASAVSVEVKAAAEKELE